MTTSYVPFLGQNVKGQGHMCRSKFCLLRGSVAYTYTYAYACTYTHAHAHVHAHKAYTHICIRILAYTHAHTYTHMHLHLHLHIQLVEIYVKVNIRPLMIFRKLLATLWQSFMVGHHLSIPGQPPFSGVLGLHQLPHMPCGTFVLITFSCEPLLYANYYRKL